MKSLLLSLVLLLVPGLLAEPEAVPVGRLERDLGRGLNFVRVHTLPAELPPGSARRGATIVDLRYTRAEPGATVTLGDWLKSHCSRATPIFVLLNAETAPDVLAWFAAHDPLAGLVTLGIAAPGFTPDIELRVHPAAERAAYDALEQGKPIETLLTDNTEKPRHDEAAMALERTATFDESTESDTDIANAGEVAPIVPAAPRPVIDYTLLRAVQLDRSLVALRKL